MAPPRRESAREPRFATVCNTFDPDLADLWDDLTDPARFLLNEHGWGMNSQ